MQRSRTMLSCMAVVVVLSVAFLWVAGCSKQREALPGTGSEGVKQGEEGATGEKEGDSMPGQPPQSATADTTAKKMDPHNVVAVITMAGGGEIVFEFYPDDAPNTVNSFIKLADKKFYDGLKFHRVVPGFVVQGGDPKGDGTGDAGYNLPAEFNKRKHLEGTVAMARASDPNSASCQFYICLAPQPSLDGKYTVFGQTTKGMDLVKKIKVGDVMKSVRIMPK